MGIEQKVLEYEVDIQDVQFNHLGRFFLKFKIQSLHTQDYSGIQVKKKAISDEWANDNEFITNVVTQTGKTEVCHFEDKNFLFRLPKGFCKNDKNHDVHLLVEAFTLPDDQPANVGRKVGEGKVAVYPRTNAPRTNLNVQPGMNMYKYSDVVSLLRTNVQDKIQMHCGRMRCSFALREAKPPRKTFALPELTESLDTAPIQVLPPEKNTTTRTSQEDTPREPMPPIRPMKEIPRTPPGGPSGQWGDTISLHLPKTPPPPAPYPNAKRLAESPLKEQETTSTNAEGVWRHVARQGKEQVDVIVHAAVSLPATPNGRAPLAYTSVKTRTDHANNVKTKAKTHATLRPTHAPSWEEMVCVELDEAEARNEDLVFSVGDGSTKSGLVNYQLPVPFLKPFHQYHFEMVQPSKHSTTGTKLYISVMRKLSTLPKDASSPTYLGLECLLHSVQQPLANSVGPLIAVARIVPDYYNYRSDNLQVAPRVAGVGVTSVTFPEPHQTNFNVPERSRHGYPQISLPGKPASQPMWRHPFLFCDKKDKATLFTPGAALVIEYYVANAAMTDQFWKMRSPIGFSSLAMDPRMYGQLTAEENKIGLRIDNLPIQGSELITTEGRQPTVGLVLKLFTDDVSPDTTVSVADWEKLPEFQVKNTDPGGPYEDNSRSRPPDVLDVEAERNKVPPPAPPEPDPKPPTPQPAFTLQRVNKRRVLPIRDGELPPYDAMESVLPEYQYIFTEPEGSETVRETKVTHIRSTRRDHSTRPPDDLDQTSMTLLDHQTRELDNYRTAVQRMGTDIMTLRQNIRDLETNNSKLRLNLANYNDTTRYIVDSSQLEGLDKTEIMQRYASLKQKLTTQTAELKIYKDKVQKLQNDLIKKNDQEKEYLRMSTAHKSQQELMQRLQEKIVKLKKLEDTCKKQERVIEKLERLVQKLRGSSKVDNAASEENEVLIAENRRLRQQLEELKADSLKGSGGGDDMEKLELYQALERAEGRIISLEKQLADNSRLWGKEKADMSLKLNEAEHGFGRTGGLVLHDYPVLDSVYDKRLFRPRPLLP